MTTQADLDKLRREIADLRGAVLQKRYGIGSTPVIICLAGESPEQALERRLSHIPANLRGEVRAQVVQMPWLHSRAIAAQSEEVAP